MVKGYRQDELLKMALYTVVQIHEGTASQLFGKSREDIGDEMGWSPSNTQRIFTDQSYWPSINNIAKFCVVTNCDLLLVWLRAQFDAGVLANPKPFGESDLDGLEFYKSMSEMAQGLGKIADEGMLALRGDGEIDSGEARRVFKRVTALIGRCRVLAMRLRPIFARTGQEAE